MLKPSSCRISAMAKRTARIWEKTKEVNLRKALKM
jgi:hypothetical protein